MSLRFSVVLPVYNVERYLKRCIHSVLEQNREDYEMILVDDGSTDGSPAICDDYAESYPHIRVIHKENGGLSSARNAGIKAAQGEYVWFVDSDDWIEPDALNRLDQTIGSEQPELVRFGYMRLEGDRAERILLPFVPDGGDGRIELLRRAAFCEPGKYILSSCTHLYSRAFLLQNQLLFVSERICGSEDYLFNLMALMRAQHIKTLRQPLYSYERREGSLTQQYKADLPLKYERLTSLLLDFARKNALEKQYAGLIRRFYVWHLIYGTCFTYEYGMVTPEHGLAEGRRCVRAMMSAPEFRRALVSCDRRKMPAKRWVHWIAMYLRAEPFFYWLFVVKPGRVSR